MTSVEPGTQWTPGEPFDRYDGRPSRTRGWTTGGRQV